MSSETILNELTIANNLQIINILFDKEFIYNNVKCKYCSNEMKLNSTKDTIDGFNWRCLNYKCSHYQTTYSLRNNSWLTSFKICPRKILKILVLWSNRLAQKDILKLVLVGKTLLQRFRKFVLTKIVAYYNQNPIMLGGPGVCVQVDETMLNFKTKAHRGLSPKKQIWCLSIVDTSFKPSKCFFTLIENRKKTTLLHLISKVVRPGSIIATDEFKSYAELKNMNDYEHKTVCHKYHFVDPNSGVHTQHVESSNNKLKYLIKNAKGVKEEYRELFLNEVMFLEMFKELSYTKICEILKIK